MEDQKQVDLSQQSSNAAMINVYEFLRYQPESYKQFVCDDVLLTHYHCPQAPRKVDCFSHHSYFSFSLGGKKRIYRQDTSWLLATGSCYFVKKGAYIQERYLDVGWECMNLYVPDYYFQGLISEYYQRRPHEVPASQSSDLLIELTVDEPSAEMARHLLAYICQESLPARDVVERQFRQLVFSLLDNPTNALLTTYLSRLAEQPRLSLHEVMEANYRYNLALNGFAQIANRSLATFKREFRNLYATSPGKWLINRRLDYAQLLLNTTRLSVSELALECGFENFAHFSRVFKDKFGESPVAYRKQRIPNYPVPIPQPR